MRNDGDALASTPEDAEVDAGDVVGEVVKQPKDAPSRDEPTSMGWLARYCRHCERNPWTGFLSVFFTVLIMAVVVGAFGLARFDTENDKVGARPPRVPRAPRSFIRHIPFREIPFPFRDDARKPPLRRDARALPDVSFPDFANPRAHRIASQEWVILEDEVTSRTDAAEAALKLRDRSIGKVAGAAILPREKESEGATLMFQFESTVDGVSVFNRESILLMKEISDMVLATPGYADVCQLAYDGEGENATSLGCVPPVSPLNYFFPTVTRHANGTVANVTHDGLGADLVTDIDAVVRSFDADRRGMGYFLDGGFDPQTLHNRMTRLKYPVGAPLKGFNDNSRDEEKQENKVGKLWLDAVEKALFERFGMSAGFLSSPYLGIPSERDVEVRWYAAYLRRRDSQLIINYDLAWAFASILSVWGYMAFSTGSVFIASLGMFEILMSLPVSIFIYKLVFRIAYLGNIQVLSIFIVLGIGADDVFVFYDAFKQSALVPHVKDNILDRVTYTAERASKAISVTSFTTMMAFLATAMSKVMPISAFGILSATMVFFLFVVNVAFFPPALMLYDRYVGKMCSCARLVGDKAANAEVPGSRPASADGSPTSTATLSNDAALNDTARVRIHAWESSEKTPTLTLAPTQTKAATGGGRVRRVTVNPFALRGSYAADGGDGSDDSSMDDAESGTKNFAMDKKRLRPVEWFYREPFFRFIKSPARHAILVAFVALLLYGAWGANKLEPPAQQEQWYPSDHMMQAFANKREAFASSDEDRVIVVDVFWGLDGMDVSSVNRWKPAERGELRLTQTFDASSPEAQTHLANACDELKAATCDAPGCEGGTLLRNGAAARVICPMRDFAKYQSALNRTFPAAKESFASEMYEFLSTKHGKFLRKHVGFEAANADGSVPKMFYYRVTADSSLNYPAVARTARPVFERWESVVDSINAKAPAGVNAAFSTGYWSWTWMKTQEALVQNTVQGLLLCFVMAFVVLVVSTADLRAGFLATVAIAGTVTTVMGVGVHGIMGWDLGIGESIAAVILIGLSVDYCVHLANAYVEAPAWMTTRERRTQHALMIMGISITASAVTTVISGSILWLCILKFFSKFAFLITATIVSSFFWSVFFLPAALITFGPLPDDKWSNLKPLFTAMCALCVRRR